MPCTSGIYEDLPSSLSLEVTVHIKGKKMLRKINCRFVTCWGFCGLRGCWGNHRDAPIIMTNLWLCSSNVMTSCVVSVQNLYLAWVGDTVCWNNPHKNLEESPQHPVHNLLDLSCLAQHIQKPKVEGTRKEFKYLKWLLSTLCRRLTLVSSCCGIWLPKY